MMKVRTAMVLSLATQYSVQVLQLFSVLILARLLTPAEIGIFSVALALINIVTDFRTFGVGQYVIQEQALSKEKMSAATGVMYLISWPIGIMLVLTSPLVAEFYMEPRLQGVILVVSCNFFLAPMNGVTPAYLRREMAFGKLYFVRICSAIVRVGIVLSLAFIGFGHMSLAWASLAGAATTVLALNFVRPAEVPFLPGFRELREVVKFGSFASGAAMLKQATLALPDLVIGRMLSMEAVGIFSRGWGFVRNFVRSVTSGIRPVVLPYFADQHREGNAAGWAYQKAVAYMTCLGWPAYGFLFFMADPLIHILFGDQWGASVPVAQGLCIWGCFRAFIVFSTEVLTAVGGVKKAFYKELLSLFLRFGVIVIAVPYGLQTVAFAFGLIGVVELLIVARLTHRQIGVGLLKTLAAGTKSLLVSLYALLVPLLVYLYMDVSTGNLWLPLLIAFPGMVVGWLIGVAHSRHHVFVEIKKVWWLALRKWQQRAA